jgi:hypothetical protein
MNRDVVAGQRRSLLPGHDCFEEAAYSVDDWRAESAMTCRHRALGRMLVGLGKSRGRYFETRRLRGLRLIADS